MPSTRRHSYDQNFKLKIVAEAEAVDNNREIAREYGISESMVRKWRNQQHVLFSGELKMTAKRASMGVFNSGHDRMFTTFRGSKVRNLFLTSIISSTCF